MKLLKYALKLIIENHDPAEVKTQIILPTSESDKNKGRQYHNFEFFELNLSLLFCFNFLLLESILSWKEI